MGAMRLGTKNHSAGEDQQQFSSQSTQSFLVSESVGAHDKIFVRSKTIYVFGHEVSSSTTEEVGFSE
jgi:hypothetical protein